MFLNFGMIAEYRIIFYTAVIPVRFQRITFHHIFPALFPKCTLRKIRRTRKRRNWLIPFKPDIHFRMYWCRIIHITALIMRHLLGYLLLLQLLKSLMNSNAEAVKRNHSYNQRYIYRPGFKLLQILYQPRSHVRRCVP